MGVRQVDSCAWRDVARRHPGLYKAGDGTEKCRATEGRQFGCQVWSRVETRKRAVAVYLALSQLGASRVDVGVSGMCRRWTLDM